MPLNILSVFKIITIPSLPTFPIELFNWYDTIKGECHRVPRSSIPKEYHETVFQKKYKGKVAFLVELVNKIKSLPQTEETLRDLLSIAVEQRDFELNKWVRHELRKIESASALELIRKTYVFGAQVSFDDYMIACEWNREPKAQFWLPRRKVLEGRHKIATQIQEFLDDPETLYLGISMPPGCGKTTLIKFLLAYMCGLYPKSANMYVSYSDGMIKMMLDSLKSILTDEFEYCHNQIFNCGKPTISAEYKTVSYRRPGDFPTVGLVPLGGSVTGRTRANKFLVTDDLVANKEMARSPERLEKLWDDYLNTLTTRMIGDNVKQIQLGTIWSIYDPISRMKEAHDGDPRYKFIAIPVYDEETGESNFEYEHPDRYTMPKIMEIKERLDPVDFSCLYMQKGIQREGLALSEDSLKYYNGVLPDGEPDNVVFASDVAWGGGDSYSMPVAYVYGGDVYIHDVIFDKSDKTITKPRTVAKILSNQCKMGRFEANNGGEEYADDISRILRDEKTYRCNISSKKAPSNMSKVARIEQYVPDIKNFYFLSPKLRSNEYRKFMDEATTFSFTSKNIHDDAIDSLAMLAEYLLEKPNIGKAFKRLI